MISLDFKGVNISKEFEINVVKKSEKRAEHLKDIEKRQIKKIEPSFMQQLLSNVVPIANDEDEEEEEEEEDKKDSKKDEDKKEEDKKDKDENNEDKDEDKNEDNEKNKNEEHEKQE